MKMTFLCFMSYFLYIFKHFSPETFMMHIVIIYKFILFWQSGSPFRILLLSNLLWKLVVLYLLKYILEWQNLNKNFEWDCFNIIKISVPTREF